MSLWRKIELAGCEFEQQASWKSELNHWDEPTQLAISLTFPPSHTIGRQNSFVCQSKRALDSIFLINTTTSIQQEQSSQEKRASLFAQAHHLSWIRLKARDEDRDLDRERERCKIDWLSKERRDTKIDKGRDLTLSVQLLTWRNQMRLVERLKRRTYNLLNLNSTINNKSQQVSAIGSTMRVVLKILHKSILLKETREILRSILPTNTLKFDYLHSAAHIFQRHKIILFDYYCCALWLCC